MNYKQQLALCKDVGLTPVKSYTIMNSKNGIEEKCIIVVAFPQQNMLSSNYNEKSFVNICLYKARKLDYNAKQVKKSQGGSNSLK